MHSLPRKLKILVVDDDDVLLGILQKVIRSAGYDVVPCNDVAGAKHVFGIEHFDAVLADIRMPGSISGIQLMHELKSLRRVPVILMTGFAELCETQEAFSLGADGFLAKPFKQDELFRLLDDLFCVQEEEPELPNLDPEFCKINIEEFISGKDIRFDIYIRLSHEKYVKIAHLGEDISLDRIRSYKDKGILYLYMKKEDYRGYVGLNLKLAPLVTASKHIQTSKKLAFLRHASNVILENMYVNGVNKEGIECAKYIVENTLSLLVDHSSTYDLLIALNTHSDMLYAHSLGVSLYSAMLVKALHWISPVTLSKVCIGGLFHDIGKKEIDLSILKKARLDLAPEEIAVFETHATRGAEILGCIPGMSGDVIQIVAQHHENCLGLGYPRRLGRQRIHPLARIVSVANEFCNLALNGPNGPAIPAADAIRQMSAYSDRLDSAAFSALMRVFGIDPQNAPTTPA